jgi:hypothetical protein
LKLKGSRAIPSPFNECHAAAIVLEDGEASAPHGFHVSDVTQEARFTLHIHFGKATDVG